MPNRVDLIFPFCVCPIRVRWFRGAILFQRDGENFIDIFNRNEF
jgi:hypothetical protein